MTPAKFNVSKYDEYSVDRIVAVWPQLGMIHSGLHNCEHISSSSFESSVDVKISWLEAREGYTSEDATPFDYCQELDHIPASSVVTSANVQRQKSDSDCQACGQLLCPQWIQFVFQPEENERIQGLVSEEKLAREERQRTTQYGDDDVRIESCGRRHGTRKCQL